MAWPKFLPETMVKRAADSCKSRQASVENRSAQSKSVPNAAPYVAAVVIVPGPIKAAETTDQKRMFKMRFFTFINFENTKIRNHILLLFFRGIYLAEILSVMNLFNSNRPNFLILTQNLGLIF